MRQHPSNTQPEMHELHSWPVHLTADLRQKLLDDKLRRAQNYWQAQQQDPATIIGQVVEVRADAVTQNQDGSYSLRFPRFLRFRGFKVGEKI